MNIYLDLFATFFRIGLFTFGGGLAMLPMLEKEVVQKKGWATYDELVDYFAIGQCTPGIIAVNTATFVGYTKKKWKGAAIATLGVVSPSLVIIIFIASLMTSFASLEIVQHALAGIRIGVCVLIGQAVWKMMKTGVKDVYGLSHLFGDLIGFLFQLASCCFMCCFRHDLCFDLLPNRQKENRRFSGIKICEFRCSTKKQARRSSYRKARTKIAKRR